jgi:hypothetical protein
MKHMQLLNSGRQNKVVGTRLSSNKVRVIRGGWLQPFIGLASKMTRGVSIGRSMIAQSEEFVA